MSHTPGPWGIVSPDMLNGDLDLDPSAIVIANLNAKARTAAVVADVWIVGDDGSEQYANARLIAAAPDLLTELRVTVRRLELCIRHTSSTPEFAEAATEKTWELIRRVEGQS